MTNWKITFKTSLVGAGVHSGVLIVSAPDLMLAMKLADEALTQSLISNPEITSAEGASY